MLQYVLIFTIETFAYFAVNKYLLTPFTMFHIHNTDKFTRVTDMTSKISTIFRANKYYIVKLIYYILDKSKCSFATGGWNECS